MAEPRTREKARRKALIGEIVPPERGFYSKVLHYQGIPIKSSAEVDDRALLEAWQRLHMMLRSVPRILSNLKKHGAELHIIGKDQVTSDLPENRQYRGKPFDGEMDIDERTRGTGGLAASCGEENLLKLKDDRYFGKDICVHEFAHTIYTYGLDDSLRDDIEKCYRAARKKRLWTGCYARTSVTEYFAELAMWFFGTEGDLGKLSPPPQPGPAWLSSYDSGAFDLFDDIFAGRKRVKKAAVRKLKPQKTANEKKMRSPANTQSSSIRFINKSEQIVKVFWLSYGGKRKLYQTLEPLDSYTQPTYAEHTWIVTDTKGRTKAIFVSEAYGGIATLKTDN